MTITDLSKNAETKLKNFLESHNVEYELWDGFDPSFGTTIFVSNMRHIKVEYNFDTHHIYFWWHNEENGDETDYICFNISAFERITL